MADRLSVIDKIVKTEGIGSIDSKFNFPNVQLSQSGSVSDKFQSQTSALCVPSSGQSSLCNRHIFPVQISLTPKWDLSWVLVCLQKAQYEPLHKASKLHVTLKTALLLALATAKRCSKIHALAMDSNHLRFSQSDESVSLTVQTGFLAKKSPIDMRGKWLNCILSLTIEVM